MKKQFAEEQFIGSLREAESGIAVKGSVPGAGFLGGELLSVVAGNE